MPQWRGLSMWASQTHVHHVQAAMLIQTRCAHQAHQRMEANGMAALEQGVACLIRRVGSLIIGDPSQRRGGRKGVGNQTNL